ncbi:hypothetical protein LTR17_008790 [Elasticomyces elasticus]|nr:hypothetical protein LTR17_008790 [Elasticomyces elasticus]
MAAPASTSGRRTRPLPDAQPIPQHPSASTRITSQPDSAADVRGLPELDLDNIPQARYDEGFRDGYEKGQQEMTEKAKEEGFRRGKAEGVKAGNLQARQDAYENGREQGEKEGRVKGVRESVQDVAALREIFDILPFIAGALEQYSQQTGKGSTTIMLRLRSVLPRLQGLAEAKLIEDLEDKIKNTPLVDLREVTDPEAAILESIAEGTEHITSPVSRRLRTLLPQIKQIGQALDEQEKYAVDIVTPDFDLRDITQAEAVIWETAFSTGGAGNFTSRIQYVLRNLRSHATAVANQRSSGAAMVKGKGKLTLGPDTAKQNTQDDSEDVMQVDTDADGDHQSGHAPAQLEMTDVDEVAEQMGNMYLDLNDISEQDVESLPEAVQVEFWKSKFKAAKLLESRTAEEAITLQRRLAQPFKSPMPQDRRVQLSLANRELGEAGYQRDQLISRAENAVLRLTPLKHGAGEELDELVQDMERLDDTPYYGVEPPSALPPKKKTRTSTSTLDRHLPPSAQKDPRDAIIANITADTVKLKEAIEARDRDILVRDGEIDARKKEIEARNTDFRRLVLLTKRLRDNLYAFADAFTLVSNSTFDSAAQECCRRISTWWLSSLPDSDLARLLCDCGAQDPSFQYRLQVQSALADLPQTRRFLQRVDVESYREMLRLLPERKQDHEQVSDMDLKAYRSQTGQGQEGAAGTDSCYSCKQQPASFSSGETLVECSLAVKDDGTQPCVQCLRDEKGECRVLCAQCKSLPLELVMDDCTTCRRRPVPRSGPGDDAGTDDNQGGDDGPSSGPQPEGPAAGAPGPAVIDFYYKSEHPNIKFRRHHASQDAYDNDALHPTQALPFKETKFTPYLYRTTRELLDEVVTTALDDRKRRKVANTRSRSEEQLKNTWLALTDLHKRTGFTNVANAANELARRAKADYNLRMPGDDGDSMEDVRATATSSAQTATPPASQSRVQNPGATSSAPPRGNAPGSGSDATLLRNPQTGHSRLSRAPAIPPTIIPTMNIDYIPTQQQLELFIANHITQTEQPPTQGHLRMTDWVDLHNSLQVHAPDLELHPLRQILGADNYDSKTGRVRTGFRLRGG